MILCFEQFATYDDYTMAVQFAGGIGEEYANGHTFVSPLYGKLIIFLNNLVPSLPWFNIVFTAIVFLSLTLLTYEILERETRTMALLICNVIILFFSYEGYVGTCFTKIAGIASVCGIYILLCGRKTVCNIFLSLLILCLGILLRNDMMFMALMLNNFLKKNFLVLQLPLLYVFAYILVCQMEKCYLVQIIQCTKTGWKKIHIVLEFKIILCQNMSKMFMSMKR